MEYNENQIGIKPDELMQIANHLNSKKREISDIYIKEIIPILEISKSYIKNSEIENLNIIFNELFDSLNIKLNDLTNILQYQVVPNYNDVSKKIYDMFNNEFSQEMEKAIRIINN